MKNKYKDSDLVYSTETGKISPPGNTPKRKNPGQKKQSFPPSDGIIRLMRETKGRKGKGVTLITGLSLDPGTLKKLAKSLKQKCGSGGSIKNGTIEIQGDHRDVLEKELSKLDYRVKQAGG